MDKYQTDNIAFLRPNVVLVHRILIQNHRHQTLIVKRSPEDKYFPDKWEFPGSKYKQGEDITTAFYRSALNETSLFIKLKYPVVYLHENTIIAGRHRKYPLVTLIAIASLKAGNVKLDDSHTEYKWVYFKELKDYDLTDVTKESLTWFEKLFMIQM